MEVSGGRGFFRRHALQRLLRDVHAAPYHPLPEKKQLLFSGRVGLSQSPARGGHGACRQVHLGDLAQYLRRRVVRIELALQHVQRPLCRPGIAGLVRVSTGAGKERRGIGHPEP